MKAVFTGSRTTLMSLVLSIFPTPHFQSFWKLGTGVL